MKKILFKIQEYLEPLWFFFPISPLDLSSKKEVSKALEISYNNPDCKTLGQVINNANKYIIAQRKDGK